MERRFCYARKQNNKDLFDLFLFFFFVFSPTLQGNNGVVANINKKSDISASLSWSSLIWKIGYTLVGAVGRNEFTWKSSFYPLENKRKM
jgi:hypothetical protein